MSQSDIVIRGAREHNLRNVDLRLPRNQLIVMTGVSGSGKSSLAFDTLYAEGQRRYVESLSSYARQFLGQLPKPEVDAISGLAPSISIQQKTSGRNPRSTVGTITEIYDYLRVLFARVGIGHCHKCQREITAQSTEQIIETIARQPAGTRFRILAPLIQNQKGAYRDLFEDLLKQGYLRARVDGNFVQLTDDLQLDRQMKHTIEVVVDRLVAGKTGRSRLAEAVENALKLADGSLIVATQTDDGPDDAPAAKGRRRPRKADEQTFSSRYACTHCGLGFESPGPQLFSFNSPLGMCLDCNGLGMRHDFVVDRLVPSDKLSISKGAIPLVGKFKGMGRWRRHIYKGVANYLEKLHGLKTDSLLKTPWKDLPRPVVDSFLYGTGDAHITYAWGYHGGTWKHGGEWAGFVPDLLEDYRKTKNPLRRRQLEKYMEVLRCVTCQGGRLNAQAGHVRLSSNIAARNGKKTRTPVAMSLPEVCALSIAEAARFFENIVLDETRMVIADEVLKEIRGRLGFLLKCGLDYLTLERTAPTLSGGESQRIRLAGQIGCGLVGVVYILDEPSIGLHPRDNALLLDSLCDLRDQGNTVIVVEHDEETMRAADYLVDFGPGPGVRGGEIVAQGALGEITKSKRSLTGQYLSGKLKIDIPQRRPAGKHAITVKGAEHNNLKGIDVAFPLGQFIGVTGVSGSGKSSLVNDILWQVLNSKVNGGNGQPGKHKRVNGLQHIDKAIDIDQRPIGRTPRSNPATYIKVFDLIRDLYTKLPESKLRAYKPGRFSFNVAAGRCEACDGYGSNKLEMDFLADIWVTCPVCEGRRFNHETLEVQFKGKNIAEVLEMDINEAIVHFENQPKILKLLQTLKDVGLDYLKLGQPSPTLSGGEAQRIKLAKELGKRSTGSTVYLLDEPTTGLHFADVSKLLEVLHNFVDEGNTVIVVEHNLDVLKTADHLIDLGPDGGAGGGELLVNGTPEDIARCAKSWTGKALKSVLKPKRSSGKPSTSRRRKLKPAVEAKNIVVRGASQHNLQALDVEIPRHRMSVFCGPSGSGKTSLAMDTLYAEGQRRYVESLSSYARQFLGQMPKPRVEHIHGLSPSIAIEQKNVGSTPRSTVGTVTEIYDYLRILFARLGTPYCPDCQIPIETQTTDMVIDRILEFPEKTKLLLLAPQEVEVGKSYDKLWSRLRSMGFARVRINGEVVRLEHVPAMDRKRRHQVEIVVDRITVSKRTRSRIADSVESALDLGKGIIQVALVDDSRPESDWKTTAFSLHFACHECGRSFDELTPHSFSFNSWLGWCDACEGLGTEYGTELSLLINDPNLSLIDGAIAAWPDPTTNQPFAHMLQAIGDAFRIPLDVPFRKLEPGQQRLILQGSGERWIENKPGGYSFQYKGLYPAIDEASRVSYSYRRALQEHVGEVPCSACSGSRLRDDAAAVRLNGMTIGQLCEAPLDEALQFLQSLKLKAAQKKVAGDLLTEATSRLSFLVEVGLTYITLSRPLPTLSGGECQRIRLAGQIGRALTGVLYVLDEPTIGLHPRDNHRLLTSLKKLRDLGNTLVLVEHDREVLNAADQLFDFGPGAGRFGGNVVGRGTPKQLPRKKASLTGDFLSNRKHIPIPTERRIEALTAAEKRELKGDSKNPPNTLSNSWSIPPGGGWLQLKGARLHNLRNVDLRIPLGTLTVVTGVSGSGKSSLIENTLARAIATKLHRSTESPGPYDELTGVDQINKIIVVDQQPLGSTPASNPATYTGVFEHIRELFTRLPEAKVRGYRPGRFSFNRAGGRCDDCEGLGQKCIEMHFLPDVWVQCETCRGRRFNQETLSVQYQGNSIADVLEMSIGDAFRLFENIPRIRSYLATLVAVGLDYLTLGQSAPTLSGGEAQRVKLASELARPNTGRTLYVLDEPTTGLHFDDISKLLKVLNSLVDQGNTVVVIEHNLDVIKTADWMIDLGPEAGNEGGWIVAEGTPESVCELTSKPKSRSNGKPGGKGAGKTGGGGSNGDVSHTAVVLAPILNTGQRAERDVFDAHAAARKKEGDLDLKQFGRGSKMPWQKDGRRWHTIDRVSHAGKSCQWDGEALAHVVDALADIDDLADVNWNDRSVVEITGPTKKDGWFLHALTGDEWLLTLNFRVKRNTFKEADLREKISLEKLNEIDEIHHYSSTERVRVRNLKGPWQQVTIRPHTLSDIDTPEFKAFLNKAADAFLAIVNKAAINPHDLMPWKVLGKKWHLSRKGFPGNKRVAWDATIIEALADAVSGAAPSTIIEWTGKQIVTVQHPGSAQPLAKIFTKRRGGIDLVIPTADSEVAQGRISSIGAEREVRKTATGNEEVLIRFTKKNQVGTDLKTLLTELLQ